MIVQATRSGLAEVEADVLAIGVFDGDVLQPTATGDGPLAAVLARLVEAKELPKSVGEVVPLLGFDASGSGMKSRAVLMFGLGKPAKFDAGVAFAAGVAVGKRLASKQRATVAVLAPTVPTGTTSQFTSRLVEGMIVGTESAEIRKTEPTRQAWGTLIVVGAAQAPETFDAEVERGFIVGAAVNRARHLVNLPPAEKRPGAYAGQIVDEARAVGLTAEVWSEERIVAERFGGLLGVAAGSDEPPAFVVIEHKGGGANAPFTALVGKGVTFDSGGLSLKPSASMEDMKCDMTGSAVVAATMLAVARLGLKVNVVGYLPITENMINGRAMRLGDVLTMRNGKTVEILNTDAEGRLILADALAYAAERQPARIVDLATLTGACLAALGNKIAGLCSNHDAAADEVIAASKLAGERVWRLPMDDDFLDLLKSQVADLKNIGGKYGGAITAAKFLEQFVAETPWVHLDIAGPAWADADSSTRDSGGTGCFVRTLVALLEATSTRPQA